MPALTPSLVYAAYRRALRFGVFWRLRPEERVLLFLARRLRAIRSSLLGELVVRVLERAWPEKARVLRAFEVGLALEIRALATAQILLALGRRFAPTLGPSYSITPNSAG
jgi:hypothetical protein